MKGMFTQEFKDFYLKEGGPEVLFMNTYGYSNFLHSEEGKRIVEK